MTATALRTARLACGLAAALSACARPPAATPDDLVRREAEFAEAVASGDVERFREFLAADTTFVSPAGAISGGPEAVVAEWQPILDQPETSLTWTPARAEVSDDGTLGFTWGQWRMTRTAGGGAELVGSGRYATVWRREADGVWRVALDFGNADAVPKAGIAF